MYYGITIAKHSLNYNQVIAATTLQD